MKPMLARTYGPKFNHFPCFLQPKLNGVRALAHHESSGFVMQSRDEKLWSYAVLGHIMDELSAFLVEAQKLFGQSWNPIFDGELYVHGWRLGDINSAIAVKRLEPTVKTKNVEFHIFDTIPNLNDAFLVRSSLLQMCMQEINHAAFPHIQIVPTHGCSCYSEMLHYFHHYTSLGYEGVMLRTDEPYFVGETAHGTQYRSKTLWKHKQWEDGEFVCVGTTQGEGKASIGIGALTCGGHPEDYPNISIEELGKCRTFNVGTGFTDEERIFYAQNPPVGKMVRVRYLELTADGIPFNPSFIAVLD